MGEQILGNSPPIRASTFTTSTTPTTSTTNNGAYDSLLNGGERVGDGQVTSLGQGKGVAHEAGPVLGGERKRVAVEKRVLSGSPQRSNILLQKRK